MCLYSCIMLWCNIIVLCGHEPIIYMHICEYVFRNTHTNMNTYPKQKETSTIPTYLVKDSG